MALNKDRLFSLLETGEYTLSQISEKLFSKKQPVSAMLSYYSTRGQIKMRKSYLEGCMVYSIASAPTPVTTTPPDSTPIDLNMVVESLSIRITDQVMARVMEELERRVAELPIDYLQLSQRFKQGGSSTTTSRLPIIGVVGLLPNQAGELTSEFHDCLDLRFWNDDGSPKLKALAHHCELVILHTRHSSHSTDEILKGEKANILRVTGGVTSIKRALEEYFINHTTTTN